VAFKESLDVVLKDCKFLLNARDLEALLPGVRSYLPPLTAIYFADKDAPRFVWGFPVIHGRRLIGALCQFIAQEEGKYLEDPSYQENLRLLTPAQLKEEPYFKVLSDHLLETLAEGAFLRLDSVLWIYLADLVCRRLNQDEVLARLIEKLHPNEHKKLNAVEMEMGRLRYANPQGYAEVRNRVLRSLFARNDFANSSMKEVFDEVPSNLLNREMIANRLVYTERPEPLYRSLEVDEAFLIKGYRLSASTFSGINRVLRMVIVGMLERARAGNLLPLDAYFLTSFMDDDVRSKARRLPSQGPGIQQKKGALSPRAHEEAEERERIAYLLSLQEAPTTYLLNHLPLHDRDYLKPIEKTVARLSLTSRDCVRKLRHRATAGELAPQYAEAVRDILRWDLFQALKSRLRWVYTKDGTFYCDNRPLTRATVPLNLDSYYEIYARSRHGTAVFIDLIGFTNRTKALTRELQEAAARGDKERYTLSSVSLAIQRVFSVRNHIEEFGGIPQGFEGDAILDTFPRAIDALRYVSAFADNYMKNRYIRFRPFERPSENPYKEGFRVGLASGDYSVISIVGRSNDLQGEKSTDRAVGHTINRASRLNSGKKGEKLFLSADDSERVEEVPDPLNLFKVHVTAKQELHNDGIASYEDTFLELKRYVKSESMSWYEPRSGRGSTIAGVTPRFRNYTFEFIFEDPRLKKVCLVRRLPRSPVLKGLEDEVVTVFEYLLFPEEEFLDLLRRDAEVEPPRPDSTRAAPTRPPVSAPASTQKPLAAPAQTPVAASAREPVPAPTEEPVSASPQAQETPVPPLPPSRFDWEEAAPDTESFLAANPGLSIDDVLAGQENVREVVSHLEALEGVEGGGGGALVGDREQGLPATRIDLSAVCVTSGQVEEEAAPAAERDVEGPDPFVRQVLMAQDSRGLLGAEDEEVSGASDPVSPAFRERLLSQPPVETLEPSVHARAEGPPPVPPPGGETREPAVLFESPSEPGPGAGQLVSPRGLSVAGEPLSDESPPPAHGGQDLTAPTLHRASISPPTQTSSIFEDGPPSDSAPVAVSFETVAPPPQVAPTPPPQTGGQGGAVERRGEERLQQAQPPQQAAPGHPDEGPQGAITLVWRGPRDISPAIDLPIEHPLLPPPPEGTTKASRILGSLSGYVYTAVMTGGKNRSRRIVIGKLADGKMADVHVYPAPPHKMAPWVLDDPFSRLLEDVARAGGRPSGKTHAIPEAILSTLMPLPMLHLARLLQRRLRGREKSRPAPATLASPDRSR